MKIAFKSSLLIATAITFLVATAAVPSKSSRSATSISYPNTQVISLSNAQPDWFWGGGWECDEVAPGACRCYGVYYVFGIKVDEYYIGDIACSRL
jgi:hypothetical protein